MGNESNQQHRAAHYAGGRAWMRMMRVHAKIQRRESAHLSGYDLTLPQFDVLAQLQGGEGISQQTLADRLLVSKGNVCGLLDRMAANGLIERRGSPEDRRVNLLFLTDEGKELIGELLPKHGAMIMQLMNALTVEEQQQLHTLLRKLDIALGEQQ